MNNRAVILLAFIVIGLTACNPSKVYTHYQHTPIAGWEKNDTLFFNIPRLTQKGEYNLNLGLRINNAYPFMGVTLIVERSTFPGSTKTADTLDCKLVDENGDVKGRGISYYQYHYHVTDFSLRQGDSLQIAIRHDMQREILPGISDIGIELERK